MCLVVSGCPRGLWPEVTEGASDDLFPSSCADIASQGFGDGVYPLETADGERLVYCANSLAGGGWRLVSARTLDGGALFGGERCLSPANTCSGRLYDDELHGSDGLLLLATSDGATWLVLTGHPVLDQFLSRERVLAPENSCNKPHFCELLEAPLAIIDHSPDFEPLAWDVASLWLMSGGLALRDAEGRNIATFNLANFDGKHGALYIRSASDDTEPYAVYGVSGALYYRGP